MTPKEGPSFPLFTALALIRSYDFLCVVDCLFVCFPFLVARVAWPIDRTIVLFGQETDAELRMSVARSSLPGSSITQQQL